MNAIKGLARRTAQSIREKVTHVDVTSEDETIVEETKKVRHYQRSSEKISVKLVRAAELLEELGKIMKDVGAEYETVPDLLPESSQLAIDIADVGNKLIASAQEHQKGIKEQGFDLLRGFMKNMPKLRDVEESRRKCQLEHEFFRKKVLDLRRSPPKDSSRIPRNEQILEGWRVELWRATENNKAVCSQLYDEGKRSLDQSVLTMVQVYSSFLSIAANGLKQQFVNARLPVYATAPLLPPAPLPPNPLPPYQPPAPAGPPGYAQGPPQPYPPQGPPQPQPNWQQPQAPQAPQQPQPQWSPQPQPQAQQWGQPSIVPPWQTGAPQQGNSTQQPQQVQALPQNVTNAGPPTAAPQINPNSSPSAQHATPGVANYAPANGNGNGAQ